MRAIQNRFLSRLAVSLLSISIILIGAACDSGASPTATPAGSQGGLAVDQASLVEALRDAGATVEIDGQIRQPFLSVQGQVLTVNGQDVQVYEYASESAAKKDAAKIQPDASISGSHINWIDQPHFYQSGKLIVLYIGTDPAVLSALESALGKPFAEGPPNPSAPPTPIP
jgi:hypothetical protein